LQPYPSSVRVNNHDSGSQGGKQIVFPKAKSGTTGRVGPQFALSLGEMVAEVK